MVATAANRLISYLHETHTPPPPPPPTGELEREAYWADIFFKALSVLDQQLSSPNEAARAKAAHKLIDLERTKLRHNRRLDGTGEPEPPKPPTAPTPAHLIDMPRDHDLEDMRAYFNPSRFAPPPKPVAAAPPKPSGVPKAAAVPSAAADEEDDGWDEDAETAAMGAHVEAVKAMSARIAAELNATPGPQVKGFDFEGALRAVSAVLGSVGKWASELKSQELEGPVRRMLERMRNGPQPAAGKATGTATPPGGRS